MIDIAGEASVLMTMQEMSTAVQYDSDQDLHHQQPVHGHGAPVAGASARRTLRALLHRGPPDFVKLADAYHAVGIRCRGRAISTGRSAR